MKSVTFHPNNHSTILQPYMPHSAKIWAAFPPYFWVSRLSLLPYIRNRPRIGSNCCLHGSFSTFIFLPIEFWLSNAISQKFCEGFASTFAFSLFALAKNGLARTQIHYRILLYYHVTLSEHFSTLEDRFLPHCSSIECRYPTVLWVLHFCPVSASIF